MKGILATVIAAMLATAGLTAQTYKLPDRHAASHDNLLANQGNAGISVENTTKYLEELFNEEEEPEFDIYTEGWDSKRVNCYGNVSVPSSVQIDVSKFAMPHPGYITSPYGYRKRFRRMHKGVDLKVNIGDTIRAAFDGRVRITNFERRGYGNYVVLRHTNDLETVYGHLSGFLVEEGQYVKVGDPIALGGNTGRSTGPHLHFETRYMPSTLAQSSTSRTRPRIPTSSPSTNAPTRMPATSRRLQTRSMPVNTSKTTPTSLMCASRTPAAVPMRLHRATVSARVTH